MNPFPFAKYLGAEYFCDREEELKKLKEARESHAHTVIISPRRLGKTGLIKRYFEDADKEGVKCIYIDVMSTHNPEEFLESLTTALYIFAQKERSWVDKLTNWIQRLNPVISFDPFTGIPQVSFNIQTEAQVKNTLEACFEWLENLNIPLAIAIDEFQQVSHYESANMEALLRSKIQFAENIQFIFSGSQQHLLAEMFTMPKRPFFSSAELMHLKPIDRATYSKFIESQFSKLDKKIDPEVIEQCLNYSKTHTFYTQRLSSKLFNLTEHTCTMETFKDAISAIQIETESNFQNYKNLLTKGQFTLLKAIAKEERVVSPTSSSFLSKHSLGAASSVKRSLNSLIEKEVIFNGIQPTDKTGYEVYDVFLQRWLQTQP